MYLNDLLDDLTHKQLIELLEYLSINEFIASRSAIKEWRRIKGLPYYKGIKK